MTQAPKRAAAVRRRRKKQTGSMIYVLIVALFLALLVFFYALAARYYTGRFPNKTTINGVDVSNMTEANAVAALNRQVQEYTLTIAERDGVTEVIRARDIDLAYDDTGDVAQLLEQYNPTLWITYYFTEDALTASEDTTYSQTKAEQEIADLNCFSPACVTKVKDASLQKNDEGFYIQAEVQGTQLDEEKTTQLLLDALSSNQAEVDLDAAGCYLAPTVYEDDETLNRELERINGWLKAEITYDFEDGRLEVADNTVIKDWIVQQEDGAYAIDYDLVFEWVKTTLAYQYDTFGLTHVVTTHSGETLTLTGGDYGWCIDRPTTTEALIEAVEAGTVGELEPAYLYTAQERGVDDIGGTYVEVSIADQTMWCYKDYEVVVETPVVTGNPNKGNATPSGSVWAFDCHKSPATLGSYVTMGYSSYVNFWMSFTGNVGIHDASWRSTYGGDIYLTNGSHGCVNTPYEAAKKIYETVNVGVAVFVY
ncbi:MAG: L,D-transpeptidase/peptidoglycan binding protein [Clostridiales bacterium]|nr:L,D-transpeptidase/peptidoglycan binding protein [Clostridiales bacterium]